MMKCHDRTTISEVGMPWCSKLFLHDMQFFSFQEETNQCCYSVHGSKEEKLSFV